MIGRLLCRLGWHDYCWVGHKEARISVGVTECWNHECSRCGDTIDLSTPIN